MHKLQPGVRSRAVGRAALSDGSRPFVLPDPAPLRDSRVSKVRGETACGRSGESGLGEGKSMTMYTHCKCKRPVGQVGPVDQPTRCSVVCGVANADLGLLRTAFPDTPRKLSV